MSEIKSLRAGLDELAGVAFSLPLFSLFLAMLLVAALFVVRAWRSRAGQILPTTSTGGQPTGGRYITERRSLRAAAIIVVVAFAAENVLHGYVLNLAGVVAWWRYAAPVSVAALCLVGVLLLIVLKGSSRPEEPAIGAERRDWVGFGPLNGIIGAGIAFATLLTTSVAAGLASSADDRGRYIFLAIPVPNQPIDDVRPWFFGWAYGVPMIVCALALAIVTWMTLRGNAIRPFLRPATMVSERAARAGVASATVQISTAAVLLSLGGAWRFIAQAGSITGLSIDGDGRADAYEAMWQHAEFAIAAGWLAPAVEVTAFVLLLLVAFRRAGVGVGKADLRSVNLMAAEAAR